MEENGETRSVGFAPLQKNVGSLPLRFTRAFSEEEFLRLEELVSNGF